MSVAYQSIGNSPGATSTSCVITKPTGLTAGDLMVSIIAVRSTTITITPPASWTLIQAETSATSMGFHSYSKVADSGDASATDFTFTLSGSERNIGSILRIDGQDDIDGSTKNFDNSNTTTPTTGAITPTKANCMFILASMNTQSSATQRSGYTMATSSPTWTERAELGYSDTTAISFGVATSDPRPETSSTGNFSLSQNNETHATIAIAVSPSGGPANLKTFNTVAAASIKTVNTIAIASVKSVNTIT